MKKKSEKSCKNFYLQIDHYLWKRGENDEKEERASERERRIDDIKKRMIIITS